MFASQPEDHFDAARSEEVVQLEASLEARALKDAVHTTLANTEAGGSVTHEEIAALQEVARRNGSVPLTFDPLAIELVEAIINTT